MATNPVVMTDSTLSLTRQTLTAGSRLRQVAFVSCLLALSGCMSVVSSFTTDFAEDLGNSILDNPDVEMVQEGAPAFLLLLDSLVAQSPDNPDLLMQSSRLTSAYAAAFVNDPERAKLMADKAFVDMQRSVCLTIRDGCDLRTRPFEEYDAWVLARTIDDVPQIYQLATVWSGWIQANSEDFAAIAELGRAKALMLRVAELDETFDYGGPHLYLGVFETLLPPSLGGRPEVGREHFERAIEISEGRYLMTKVFFADQYARLLFDRELHDQLLGEVVSSDPAGPGLTLINTVAQRRAQELLDTADAYF